jgi:hypothetical protein
VISTKTLKESGLVLRVIRDMKTFQLNHYVAESPSVLAQFIWPQFILTMSRRFEMILSLVRKT